MRKIVLSFSLVLICCLVFCFSSFVSAGGLQLFYNGEFHDYTGDTYSISIDGENLQTDVPGLSFDGVVYVPLRNVVEKLGGSVQWNSEESTVVAKLNRIVIEIKDNVNNAIVNGVSKDFATPVKTVNSRIIVPAGDLAYYLNMNFNCDKENKIISFRKCTIGQVTYRQEGNRMEISVPVGVFGTSIQMELHSPERIVVDIPNALAPLVQQTINVNKGIIKSIRYALFTDNSIGYQAARVVLDVDEIPTYQVLEGKGELIISVANKIEDNVDRGDTGIPGSNEGNGSGSASEGNTGSEGSSASEGNTGSEGSSTSESNTGNNDNSGTENNSEGNNGSNPGDNDNNGETPGGNDGGNSNAGSEDGTVNNGDTKPGNSTGEENDKDNAGEDSSDEDNNNENREELPIFITQALIEYSSEIGRDLAVVKLPRYDGYTVSIKEDADGVNLILTLPDINAPLQEYIIDVGSSNLKEIKFFQYDDLNARIVFKLTSPVYYISEEPGKLMISFFKDEMPILGKLVVIDPGHGGKENGATYFNTYEKDLNFDIAVRLNELLKSNGVNTYMIRTDDSYVDFYDRPEIANKLNADLFISIHNNALGTGAARGTETYYYQDDRKGGIDSKRFAQIVQEKLAGTLGTVDRGVKTAGFVVIKYTKMPAVLSEIAFMDNKDDFALISNPEFRQKVANALCEAIIQALMESK